MMGKKEKKSKVNYRAAATTRLFLHGGRLTIGQSTLARKLSLAFSSSRVQQVRLRNNLQKSHYGAKEITSCQHSKYTHIDDK